MRIARHFTRLFFLLSAIPALSQAPVPAMRVKIVPIDAEKRVDIYVDDELFTSYIYPDNLEKPVLYPVRTATGKVVTRGFPLQPRPGERIDHPHQTGWWFNYGDVNGLDFWNNSYAIPAADKARYGSIRNVKVLKTTDGPGLGTLVVECGWVDQQNNALLHEETTFEFSGDPNLRRVVRTTRLTAVNGTVRFGDSKEGLCAMRVDRAFETPSETPEIFTDAAGNATALPVLNNTGVNGIYRSSEGMEKDAVWGTRASWVTLSASKDGESISLAMLDHPENPGYPAYWHARGYGLFSVNNLGRNAYNPAEPENLVVLEQGATLTFKHMLLVCSGGFLDAEKMKTEASWFARQ